MSSYYPRFKYLGINSQDKNLIVVNLDGGDSGEADTFLGMEPIYTENASGTQRLDYGARFNNVAVIKITTIKQDGSDFSVQNTRDCLKWITGSRVTSPLDLVDYTNEEFEKNHERRSLTNDGKTECKIEEQVEDVFSVYIDKTEVPKDNWTFDKDSKTVIVDVPLLDGRSVIINYSKIMFTFIGRVTNAWHYKMDARTVGITFEFTSISPWAYSPVKTITETIDEAHDNGKKQISLPNDSDDVDTPVYMKTTFVNKGVSPNNYLFLTNNFTGEKTEIRNLVNNETIIIDSNQMITSEGNPTRVFGSDFNFVFPCLKYNKNLQSGDNTFTVEGIGDIKFEYVVPIKAGDCVMDVSSKADPICDEAGYIQIDTLSWSRISDKPKNLSEYGLSGEVNEKIDEALTNYCTQSYINGNYYTKDEIDTILKDFVSEDVYTKGEIDAILSSAKVEIDEIELNKMLAEVLN